MNTTTELHEFAKTLTPLIGPDIDQVEVITDTLIQVHLRVRSVEQFRRLYDYLYKSDATCALCENGEETGHDH